MKNSELVEEIFNEIGKFKIKKKDWIITKNDIIINHSKFRELKKKYVEMMKE